MRLVDEALEEREPVCRPSILGRERFVDAELPSGDGGWLGMSAAVFRRKRSARGTAWSSVRSRTGDNRAVGQSASFVDVPQPAVAAAVPVIDG